MPNRNVEMPANKAVRCLHLCRTVERRSCETETARKVPISFRGVTKRQREISHDNHVPESKGTERETNAKHTRVEPRKGWKKLRVTIVISASSAVAFASHRLDFLADRNPPYRAKGKGHRFPPRIVSSRGHRTSWLHRWLRLGPSANHPLGLQSPAYSVMQPADSAVPLAAVESLAISLLPKSKTRQQQYTNRRGRNCLARVGGSDTRVACVAERSRLCSWACFSLLRSWRTRHRLEG